MKNTSLIGLAAVGALLTLLSLGAICAHIFSARGDTDLSASYDKFDAKVKSGGFSPATMKQFADSWFDAAQQDHQVIKAKESMCNYLSGAMLVIGVVGLVAALFQAFLIWRLHKTVKHDAA